MYMNSIENKIYDKRWIMLFSIVIFSFMSTLDGSIVNVALPVISYKLSVSMASIQWAVTSYLMIILGTILVFGRIADIKGKTTVFKLGVLIFTIGSFLCGFADSLIVLVLSRCIQAIGAAGVMATCQGLITQIFPSNERGRALGINGTFVALGSVVGPPLGGIIVSILSWRYIFLINVPIGILAFAFAIRILPKGNNKNLNEGFDKKGAVLFGIIMILLFGSLTLGANIGYDNKGIILSIIVSISLFILFIRAEQKIPSPLIKLGIFNNCLFSLSLFCSFISYGVMSCLNIILPFYLQYVMKLTPSTAGILMMASPLILSIIAPMSGYISDKIGSEVLTLFGLIGTSLGVFFMTFLNQYSNLGEIIIFISIISIGNGIFQSPNNSLTMSAVNKKYLGIAGSINSLVRNLGMIFGISLSTTFLYSRMSSKIGYHVTGYINGRDDVFVYGMQCVYIAASIICMGGALLTAYRLYNKHEEKKLSDIFQ